jgi:hypothetical protein
LNCSWDAQCLALHLRQAVPTAHLHAQNVVHCCENVTKLGFESAFASFESELAELSASSGTPDLVIVFLASHGFELDSDIFVAFKDTNFGPGKQNLSRSTSLYGRDLHRRCSSDKPNQSRVFWPVGLQSDNVAHSHRPCRMPACQCQLEGGPSRLSLTTPGPDVLSRAACRSDRRGSAAGSSAGLVLQVLGDVLGRSKSRCLTTKFNVVGCAPKYPPSRYWQLEVSLARAA